MFIYVCVGGKFFSIILFSFISHSLSTFSCNEYLRKTNLLAALIILHYFVEIIIDNDPQYYKGK